MSDSLTEGAQPENARLTELRAQLETSKSKLRSAKIAYHHRAELDGKIPEYDDLATIARTVIASSYELQKHLYGGVRMKMFVAKLLRSTSH